MYDLYLVQVVDNYGPNKFLPLAISYQWLYAKEDPDVNNKWRVVDVLIEKVNIAHWLNTYVTETPHAFAISSYIWNWNFNQELVRQIKQRWPECLIITGGPQIDKHDPEWFAKYPNFDVAILGEGEESFREILKRYPSNNFDDIPHVHTSTSGLPTDISRTIALDKLPSPILTGFYDEIIDRYEQRYGSAFMWQVTYETMRGCPYHCTFCDIGDSYWNKATMFAMDRIEKEIEWMSKRKIEYVSVCDSNWGLFPRDIDITQLVINAKLKTGYPQVWDVTWAKNNQDRVKKIAQMDYNSGTRLFKGITFAMQSLNPDTLAATERLNMAINKAEANMKFYLDQNIPTYSELIWPMPNETLDTLVNGIQQLVDAGQKDFLMVHPLVVTPNAPMGQKLYQTMHGLKSLSVPLDTFWLKIEDKNAYIPEYVDAVYETNSTTFEETIYGNIFAYWLIVLYYYGWGHYVIQYVKNKLGVNETNFIKRWIEYVELNIDSIAGQEHLVTKQSYIDVYTKKQFWGRQISNLDNTYWEYKSATSIVFHRNRQEIKNVLIDFLKNSYNFNGQELVDLNFDLCCSPIIQYPIIKEYPLDLIKNTLGLSSETLKIDHWDKQLTAMDDEKFVNVAYHYQRKNRYWRCNATPV